ncbi:MULTISPECIES: AraC family transcriptional regulator [Bacteroides]|nr:MULTISPECIES: AraC family transcriptional regulator [Bacteroides]
MHAIAPLAGFNSRSAYYTTFSRVFGMTPMQYRETLKEEEV